MADCWVAHPDLVDQVEIHVNKYTSSTIVNSTGALTATTEQRRLIEADASGGAITITLPAASTWTGQIIEIIKIDSSNDVDIDGNGIETIDGDLTQKLKKQYEEVTLYSNGTEIYII